MKESNRKRFTLMLLFLISVAMPVFSEEVLRAGVAANYIKAFNEISAEFKAETGIKVEATFTSSGNLYNQVVNGAPYDLLLSADEERPALLFKNGITDKPFVYAKGEVVLWSSEKNFCRAKDWKDKVKTADVKKIAIANPDTAPYGKAAMGALQKAGLQNTLKSKIVNSQDIAQAFQYASTGAVDAGFCALSSAKTEEGKKGCFYSIKEAQPVVQSACIIKNTKNRKAAEKFAAFLNSKKAAAIKEKYGYK